MGPCLKSPRASTPWKPDRSRRTNRRTDTTTSLRRSRLRRLTASGASSCLTKNPACDCPDCRCEACDCGKLKGRKAKLDAAVEDNAFVQGLSVHIDELRARLDKVEAENATLREHHAKHHQEEQARAKAAAARHDAPSLYRSSSGSSYYRQPPSTASRFFRN
jgi:hypothetical protein